MPDTGALFPATRWSLVCRISSPEEAIGRAALETLCQSYWFPLYSYARRFGLQESDAKDTVQDTFSRLLVNNRLALADAERGRLRTFLLATLKNVMNEARRKEQTAKRGGGSVMLSLDMQDAEGRYLVEPPAAADSASPERQFELQWAREVIEGSMRRLKADYCRSGKSELFDALEPALRDGKRWNLHAETASKLGMAEGALKVALHRLRQRFRDALQEEVRQTVMEEKDAEDEIRHLLAAFAR